jgi:hypothetical protein
MMYILVHKMRGYMTPEQIMPMMEPTKNLVENPSSFVPGGKLIGSYVARNKNYVVCVWDAPDAEALSFLVEQMELGGWDTDIMLGETMAQHLERITKAFAAIKK